MSSPVVYGVGHCAGKLLHIPSRRCHFDPSVLCLGGLHIKAAVYFTANRPYDQHRRALCGTLFWPAGRGYGSRAPHICGRFILGIAQRRDPHVSASSGLRSKVNPYNPQFGPRYYRFYRQEIPHAASSCCIARIHPSLPVSSVSSTDTLAVWLVEKREPNQRACAGHLGPAPHRAVPRSASAGSGVDFLDAIRPQPDNSSSASHA